ncbi:MAG: hypothetical protein JWM82_2973 [Myxococcales bacterium]|nr:hypothetical protein [Myxococcales bacterium]
MNRPRPPVELVPASARRPARWMRRLFDRGAPRARMVAPPEVRLGERLEVEWGLDCPEGDLVSVRVALVGTEIARQHLSARTGISVVSETSDFVDVELARVPAAGLRIATGRASGVVPARAVPSLAGRHNEIAWALVVEATFVAAPALRESFPLVVSSGVA